jgi:hypothetical protein
MHTNNLKKAALLAIGYSSLVSCFPVNEDILAERDDTAATVEAIVSIDRSTPTEATASYVQLD